MVSYQYDSQNKRVFTDAQYQNHPCLTLPTVRSTLATVQAHEETVAKVLRPLTKLCPPPVLKLSIPKNFPIEKSTLIDKETKKKARYIFQRKEHNPMKRSLKRYLKP